MMITSELEKVEQRFHQVREQQERISSPAPVTTPRYTRISSGTTTTTYIEPPITPFVHEPATVTEEDYHVEGKHWTAISQILYQEPIKQSTTTFETPKEYVPHPREHPGQPPIFVSTVTTTSPVLEEVGPLKPELKETFQVHEFHRRTRLFSQGGRRILVPLVPSFKYCRLFEWLNRTFLSSNDLVDLLSLHANTPSTNQMDAVIIPSDPHELYSPNMEPTLYAAVSSGFVNLKNVEVLITTKGALLNEELARTDEYKSDVIVVPWGVPELDVYSLVNSCPVPLVIFK